MLTSDTKRKIDSARDILVGKIPVPTEQVEQITLALVYKFMSDIDKQAKKAGDAEGFFGNGYHKYAWGYLMDKSLSAPERLKLYREGLEKMSQNPYIPQLFREIFKNAFLPFNDAEVLKLFLKTIDDFTYDHSEELGNAFEYLLQVMGSQGDAGQFRTPRHIIDFIVACVDPSKSDRIHDPACGTAGFLISAFKHLEAKGLTTSEKAKITQNFIGYDISHQMVRLSLVNMYLHHFPDPQILEYDTLGDDLRWDAQFDCILANPPFMSPKGGIRPHNRFAIQAKRSEVLFVDYIMEHLSTHGKAGVIVPEGIIFQSGNAYKSLRKLMIENNFLWCVVSLPSGVFNPYAGVKTSILLFDKQIAQKSKSVLFVKIEADGFDLGAQRRKIDKNDLTNSLTEIQAYKQFIRTNKASTPFTERLLRENAPPTQAIHHDKFILAKKSFIAESGDYNLSGDRYKPSNLIINTKWPIVEMGEIFQKINNQVDPQKGQGNITYVGLENIESNTSRLIGEVNVDIRKIKSLKLAFKKHDVLFGKLRPNLNKVWLADREGVCSTDILVLRGDCEKILPELYALILRSANFNIEVLKGLKGAQLPRVGFDFLSKIKVPLPPLEIQEQIVKELDGYAAIISGAKQIVTNWKPKINIDPEWVKVKLGEVCSFEYGAAMPEKNRVAGDFPVVGSNGIVGTHKDYLVEGPTIVVGRKGSAGEVNWIEKNSFPIDTTYFVKIKDKIELNYQFLYFVLLNLDLQGLRGGGAVPGLNRNDAYGKEISLPTLAVQKQIIERIEAERELVEASKKLIKFYVEKTKSALEKLYES